MSYALLYNIVKLHAILPFGLLYRLSDLLFVILYYLLRYRRNVVHENMTHSFPEKNKKEIKQLEVRFYRHFADYILETIKLAHVSHDEILKRAHIRNPELIDDLIKKGHSSFVLLMGHYGNWEWFSATSSCFENAIVHQIYRPLNNKAVDRLFIQLRTKFGSVGIKKQEILRDIVRIRRNKTNALLIFLADQTPSRANLHYWTQFMNQDTPVLNGFERIAKRFNQPVVYLDMHKIKRGYYEVEMKLLTETPADTEENWITETYIRYVEETIMRDPAYWLWSHKRWKYKRDDQ